MPMKFILAAFAGTVFLTMSACTQDVLEREEYLRKLNAIENADIRIVRRLFDTADQDTCAIEIRIDLNADGNGKAIWSRPDFQQEWPTEPCIPDDSAMLHELSFSLDQHRLARIHRSLARLPWGLGFDKPQFTEFRLPIGCSTTYHGSVSHIVTLEKKGRFMAFNIEQGCNSVQVGSAQLLIDDVIRLLPTKQNLMP